MESDPGFDCFKFIDYPLELVGGDHGGGQLLFTNSRVWLDLNSNLFFRGFNNINSSHQLKTVNLLESFGVVAGVREEAVERGQVVGGGDGVVGAEVGDVRDLKTFILLEMLNHNTVKWFWWVQIIL